MNIDPSSGNTNKELSYIQKVWQTVAIVALLVVVILIARVAFNVLLMILAGALIAVYFHGFGDLIERKTRLNRRWSMIISVGGSFVFLGTLLWFMGSKMQDQISVLSDSLPNTITAAKVKMDETHTGRKILTYLSGDNSEKLFSTAQQFFSTSFGVMGNLYVIILLAIFFTANPSIYKDGIIILVPSKNKPLARVAIDRISTALKGWLKGTMLSMVLITFMIAIGLTIMGIPGAMVLAMFTGMLKLIPNFGSMAAMIPGVLLALTVSTNTAIIVALIYVISQTIVSNIVTPLIQKRMINLPPALTIISQVIMGTLSGALGIILAVPLLAIVIILVDELYVKKMGTERS
ncbi:putative PurR-regulated permease PerM [Pedobacter cryoconitis]|uniref:Putative PurR-regulated permease PerM n=1 Tax=Pedobacter cryoconitis TaxID=188932 RepID=A0A7W8ZJM7_9SPHI|nr:AI-2E family transporter [Pedobacter cryoconitis]MBB5635008.1 putative PurR-regulated permease PerM [Pedobacter cryoconitis]MBB6271808.1 putative PurR-regulated permease PerM [Pedobacter cryoconitis]